MRSLIIADNSLDTLKIILLLRKTNPLSLVSHDTRHRMSIIQFFSPRKSYSSLLRHLCLKISKEIFQRQESSVWCVQGLRTRGVKYVRIEIFHHERDHVALELEKLKQDTARTSVFDYFFSSKKFIKQNFFLQKT